MNKKQGDQMQFSLERRLEKRKWIHPTHHTSLWIVIDSSVLLEFFSFVSKCLSIMQQKKQLRLGSEKNGEWKLVARQLRLSLASQLCVFDDRTDLNWKWVKKLKVWFCYPNYLVYLWRYRSAMFVVTQFI